MVVALTLLTSSQGILIVWSKRNGKYEYSVTTSNFMVSIIIIFFLKRVLFFIFYYYQFVFQV